MREEEQHRPGSERKKEVVKRKRKGEENMRNTTSNVDTSPGLHHHKLLGFPIFPSIPSNLLSINSNSPPCFMPK
jgi:hypothetical protein